METADSSYDMPFARDSPAPIKAVKKVPSLLLHSTNFSDGPARNPLTQRMGKRSSRSQVIHVRADSLDSLEEPTEPTSPNKHASPRKKIAYRPSLADLTNSTGVLALQRGRLATVKSVPALRTTLRGRSGGSPIKGAIAPARRAEERLDLAQVISSSVPELQLSRRDSLDSLNSLESLVDLLIGEKKEVEEPFTPCSPEVVRIVEKQWTEIFAKDEREREQRRLFKEPATPAYQSFVVPMPLAPPAVHMPPVREIRHAASTPLLRNKPSVSSLAGRREPKLLRTTTSVAALRPVVSPASGEIGTNGSARVVNDPTPLRRRQQTSKETSVPPKGPLSPNLPSHKPNEPASKQQDATIVSFPNAEQVAEKLNAAIRAKRRQKKWWNDWLAFGPSSSSSSSGKRREPTNGGAKMALRELLGDTRPTLSRAPSFELAPRITVSEGL